MKYYTKVAERKKEKSKQLALTEGIIDDIENGFWLTPPELYKKLDDEFHFNFDAAPFPRPAGFDAIREEWGSITYVNPPIKSGVSVNSWVKKAIQENRKGKTVVMLIPFPRWFRHLLLANAEFRFPGPIYFLNAKGQKSKSEGGGLIPDIVTILKSNEKGAE